MKYQQGATLWGMLFWGVFITVFAILAMKTVPAVTEYYKVLKDVKATVNRVGPDASVAEVRDAFDKMADVDMLNFSSKQLEVTKEGGKIVIKFEYEKRVPLFANVSLLFDFKGSSND